MSKIKNQPVYSYNYICGINQLNPLQKQFLVINFKSNYICIVDFVVFVQRNLKKNYKINEKFRLVK